MKANEIFMKQKPEFWAYVKTLSQSLGYTNRSNKTIKVPTIIEIQAAFKNLNLSIDEIINQDKSITIFGNHLLNYFQYRADVLNINVKNNLMNRDEAENLFHIIRNSYEPQCPLPMNKQKGEKKNFAFLTCIVNMILEKNLDNLVCDYDPRILTSITHNNYPFRTLSRRVDGAFPSPINPIAIWEIKEYYYTKTFGSRVADGVYETLLDGMEIRELSTISGHRKIQHILIVDDYFTWWDCGRSYLCRIIDMLHMGIVEEVLFGKEVIERLPALVGAWKREFYNTYIKYKV